MFFLSKFLPIFFYPLGLTCVLLAIALFRFWHHPKSSGFYLISALFLLLITSNGYVSQSLMKSLEWQNLPQGELPKAEAIVVLGGGIKPSFPPRAWIETNEAGDRILYGTKLYLQGKAPWLILSGGRVEWKEKGLPESHDMAEIATLMGVPSTAILEDTTSLNTYQNALNVRKILDNQGIQGKILLVTSAFHLPRSLLIFQRQGIDVIPAPTDFFVTQQDLEDLYKNPQMFLLNLLPTAHNLEKTTKALKEYIGLIVYRLFGWL